MTIFTRFGSEVDVLGGDIEKGEITTRRKVDGAVKEHFIRDYVADNGICEIEDAIEAANAKSARISGLSRNVEVKRIPFRVTKNGVEVPGSWAIFVNGEEVERGFSSRSAAENYADLEYSQTETGGGWYETHPGR